MDGSWGFAVGAVNGAALPQLSDGGPAQARLIGDPLERLPAAAAKR